MNNRLTGAVLFATIVILGIWYLVSPLYKHEPEKTLVATVIKPSAPLESKMLRGHWNLVFFGYMKCPKICPGTLGLVRDAWRSFPENQIPARFIFANLTDTNPDELKDFLHNYHASFIGLTNDSPDMQYLYEKLNIFAKEEGAEINHTAALMLIDPQGRLRAIFTPPFTAGQLVADLKSITKNR